MFAGDVNTPRTSPVSSDQADRLLDYVRSITPAVRCSYEIGAQHIAVHYLSEKLYSRLHPSLAHLAAAFDSPAELTIIAQVSESPPIQLTNDEWTAAGQRWSQSDTSPDAPSANFTPGDGGRLDLIAPARRIALSSFRNVTLIPAWDMATPFRDLLHRWFREHDGHLIHGAVVADGRSAVALAGTYRAGKSSTAFACLHHSALECLGDDVFLARKLGGEWHAFSLYNACKLLPHDVERFTQNLAPLDDSVRGDGKPTFYLHPAFAGRLPRQRRLAAILLPRITGKSETTFSPAKPGETWRALVPSTLALTPASPEGIKWLTTLARHMPSWWLNIGTHREAIPPRIAELILLAGQTGSTVQAHPVPHAS
ncbi:MAG: hypothetical protein Q7J60_01530 [Bradyrhizobium sp.]|nr:hypothetical protein [Bradyrhizobium sp.]